MDETTCARILWAATARLRPSSDHAGEPLRARKALAEILRRGVTSGFPAPLDPSPKERESPAWRECAESAIGAGPATASTPAMFALLWAGDEASRPPQPVEGHGLSWPNVPGAAPETVIGPMEDGSGRTVYLFLYRDIDTRAALEGDGDAAPGLFPRAGRAAGPLPFVPTAADTAPAVAWTSGWSWILLGSSVVLAGLALVWVYGAADFARGAVNEIMLGTLIDREVAQGRSPAGNRRELYPGTPAVEPVEGTATSPAIPGRREVPPTTVDENGRLRLGGRAAVALVVLAGDGSPTVREGSAFDTAPCLAQLGTARVADSVARDREACGMVWRIAWANQMPSAARGDNWWRRTLAGLWGPTNVDGQLSLLWPLVLAALSVVALILGAGVATRRYMLGALIDERSRLSLSRLQQLAWTVVLFGGFTVLGLFNISLLAAFVRDLGQGEALRAISPETGAQVAALPEFWAFFPSMDPMLWAVLGITVVISPYLSQRILASKPVKDPGAAGVDFGAVEGRASNTGSPLAVRDSPAHAQWTDLFRGEEEANADQVDVSRLQHLVITGLLLGGYVVLLLEYVRTVDGSGILLANLTGAPVFAVMPPVDGTFVGLLALSHTGYLAFKALPAKPTGGSK